MELPKLKNLTLKQALLASVAISAVVFLSRLYEPSLSGDSAKYALVAKTMLKTGNFWIPHLGDEPYFKKLPFFFWIIALSFKVFGLNEFAARLPSALFGVADAALLTYIGHRITKDPRIALLTGLIFILNFEVIRITTIVRFDSFLLFVNLASLLLLTSPRKVNGVVAGLLSGAGVLTKGPFGIIGITTALIYFTLKRDPRLLNGVIALATSLIPGALYLAVVSKTYPELLKEFIGNQIVGRVTGELKEGTPRPFYFYERILLKHFWPWNAFLFIGLWKLIKKREFPWELVQNRELFKLMALFFVVVFLPLHFISLKFTRYSYYLYPFLAVLTALFVANLRLTERVVKGGILLAAAYAFVAATCPCKFHKDKLKELRPLSKVALENFTPVGIGRDLNPTLRYALMFYFDGWSRSGKFLVSGRCNEQVVIKLGKYCVRERK